MNKYSEDLLRRASKGELSDKETQEMLSLFHQDSLEFDVKAELADILDETKVAGDQAKELRGIFEKIWNLISRSEIRKERRVFPVSSFMRIAASLILGLIIGSLVFKGNKDAEKYFYISRAPKGSISQIILPDSSYIFLNAGSSIKYSMSGKSGDREVYLDGEAWFNVKKTENEPFLVHTDFYDVIVKGTEFNIRAYDEDPDVVTTLEKGSVDIRSGAIGAEATKNLVPGEQLIYNKIDKKVEIKKVETKWYTSWRDNKLIFINMRFSELVILLERKYGVDIEVADQRIMNYHYDGTIKNESIIEVLDLIKLTLPIDYRINGQVIEIIRR